MPSKPPYRKALILPGAGARGAYQVGVLKAIARMLPDRAPNPFAVISGTSAGGINAVVLASRAARFARAVMEMEHVWANFSADQVFRTDSLTMLKSSLHWLAALVFGGLGVRNPQSLLDSAPLRELLRRNIAFPLIDRALERGYLDALAITASAYTSAQTVTFYQAREKIPPWDRVRRCGRPALIHLDHLMASAAVPFIFPPVRIGGEFFGDGSVRHGAPLSSAIHLGAERMLVIGVRGEPDPEPAPDARPQPPTLAFLAGYMLDTLFMDGLYADLERTERINRILEQVGEHSLTGTLANLRHIDTMIITPKHDFRDVAARHAHELPRPLRLLLRGVDAFNRGGMRLVSYLLFESGFTSELIDMGFRDGMELEPQLRRFLSDEPIESLEAPGLVRLGVSLG